MKIKKENLRRYISRKIDNANVSLDVGTLMHVMGWLRKYKPQKHMRKKNE